MHQNTEPTASASAKDTEVEQPVASDLTPIAIAARGREITGLRIFQRTIAEDDITRTRLEELLLAMNTDQPTGGVDMTYGNGDAQHLRYWESKSTDAPIILFVHGGSWRSGTYLDSIGSTKVAHLTGQGYAFATVNYTLIPSVTVEEQVQEVADSLGYLVKNAARLGFDPQRIILMGHSSGAHVVTLLGTDERYLEKAGINIHTVRAVISLDGSNYNALAEIADSPGPVAENTTIGLGTDPKRLQDVSPTYHARAPNAGAFLLLQVQRQGDIRQAVELSAALEAAGTDVALHVFEGESFEGHMQMLLRLGDTTYPATLVMDKWLKVHVPVTISSA
ncbi:Alpha/beta hydrolase fold-3 [Penicillium expansum]|nr:Alpha/beta hydrolase fold-3 [Penicillium expansum]